MLDSRANGSGEAKEHAANAGNGDGGFVQRDVALQQGVVEIHHGRGRRARMNGIGHLYRARLTQVSR